MTDSTQKTPNHKTPEAPNQSPSNNQCSKLGIWLFAIFALAAALTSLYLNHQLRHAIKQQTYTFDATLSMLTQQQSSTEARLQAHRAITQSHEERANREQRAFEKKLRATLAEYSNVSDDWRLLKARHLLELAQLNAHWSTDKASTVAMLNEADAVLAPLHNPALLNVRKALAEDLHATESASTTDTTALFAKLNAASKSTWALSINPIPKEDPIPTSPPSNTKATAVLNFLKNVVTIHHHSDVLEPKPTLAFEAMLRASVRLSLEEAQWAVLERNNQVYQLALNQAINYLKQSFVSDQTRTEALISRLNELKQVALHAEAVIPEQALTELNQVIAKTENQKLGGAS